MVKIRIVCVGSMTESFFRQAQQEYLKRLGRFCKTEIIEVPDEKLPRTPRPRRRRLCAQRRGKGCLAALRTGRR